MSENQIGVFKFEMVKLPTANESVEKSNEKHVTWGSNNLYPDYLLRLYAESAIHSSIINSKANYIIGDGLRYVEGDNIKLNANAADTFDELISKIVKDYLIFNCFAVEVIYNSFNIPIEYHFVPAHRVRTNNNKTKFWVSKNWAWNEKPIIFERWRQNSDNSISKIFFYDGYMPSINNVYPQCEYQGSIPSIVLEAEIKKFNLNNIQNHFSVEKIITFFNGVANEDVQKQALADIKRTYTGAEGNKIIVDFQSADGKGAQVTNLSAGDWDKAYELISKSVKEDIMQGHQVTTPSLFGVMAEGQLGASTELEVGYEIFSNTYVRNKRNELLSAFNVLFFDFPAITSRLEFADKQLFSARISETLKEKIYTINELREEAGLEPLPDGDKLLTEVPHVSESVPDSGLNPAQQNMSQELFQLSEEDFEKIKDFGVVSDEFEFIAEGDTILSKQDFSKVELKFETMDEVAQYIIDNKISSISINELKASLRKDLGINVSNNDLKGMLNDLTKAGVLNVSIDDNGKIKSKPVKSPDKKVEVMYSYDVRAGYGNPIEPNTRAFCRKLIDNNRYYTREEIQTMAAIFGYDVFKYGGGYYRNPKTGELTSHCRHNFKANTVSRKNKK